MLPFSLAVRFLKAGRGQTILIITGIGIAVAAQIFVGLLINSLQLTLIDRTIGTQPQVTITSATDTVTIPDWQSSIGTINSVDGVSSVSVSVTGNGLLSGQTKTTPVLIRGFDIGSDRVIDITDSLYEGSISEGSVLAGKDLQEELNVAIGDELSVLTSAGKEATYRVSGFFDLGIQQLNETWIISDIHTAQALFDYGNAVTAIEVQVDDYFAADTIAAAIDTSLNDDTLAVSNWKIENEQLLSGLQGQSISSLMIQIFIIVSVVIAISAILAITVFQKSRQLGILKAMGIKDRAASLIFIYEGLIIGTFGSVFGVVLGLLLLYGFSIGTSQPDAPALIDLYIDPGFIVLSWGIAITASVIAALIPARRSLRLNPIDVIRES